MEHSNSLREHQRITPTSILSIEFKASLIPTNTGDPEPRLLRSKGGRNQLEPKAITKKQLKENKKKVPHRYAADKK